MGGMETEGGARGFVGRERELAELVGALRAGSEGRGGVFFLCGEPGIGKTRLSSEMAEQASALGYRVLWGRCWEGEGAPAFWPWAQVLRTYARSVDPETLVRQLGRGAAFVARMVPEVADVTGVAPVDVDSEHARFRLYDAVASLLSEASRPQPMLLILDDLHWADRPSTVLLEFVAREVRDVPLVIIGTYREEELRGRPDLAEPLAQAARQGHRVPLRGLGQEDVAAILTAFVHEDVASVLAAPIRRSTGGNPFFVQEYVRLLAAEGRLDPEQVRAGSVPEGVRETIRRRVASISERALVLLEMASVMGRDFALRPLADALEMSRPDAVQGLEEAMGRGLVSAAAPGLGTYIFVHALVRETIYDELDVDRRLQLHLKIGESLERSYGARAGRHAAELAHHFMSALPYGSARTALSYVTRAAHSAAARLAYDEAARLYRRGVALMDDVADATELERCDLLLALGEVTWRSGGIAESTPYFHDAAGIAASHGWVDRLSAAALGIGAGHFLFEDRGRSSIPVLEQALEAVEQDDPARPRLLARLGQLLTVGGAGTPESVRRGYELIDEALVLARASGDDELLGYVLFMRHWALGDPRHDLDRLAMGDELVSVANKVGRLDLRVWAHGFRCFDFVHVGDVDRGMHWYARAMQLAGELAEPFYLVAARFVPLSFALFLGRYEEAERALEELSRDMDRVHIPTLPLLAVIAKLELDRATGRETNAAGIVDPLLGIEDQFVDAFVLGGLVHMGRLEEAVAPYERLLANLPTWIQTPFAAGVLVPVVDACIRFEDSDRARVLYDHLAPYEGRLMTFGRPPFAPLGDGHFLRGRLAKLLRRYDTAEHHYRESLQLFERLEAKPWIVRTQHEYAHLLLERREAGDVEKAMEVRDRALALAGSIGMQGAIPELLGLGAGDVAAVVPAGTVTIAFSDIESSTDMIDGMGDLRSREVMDLHNRIVREQIAAHGGYEVKAQGDGFMMAFGSARSAVRCAIDIQRSLADEPGFPALVRVGIHTGEPLQEDSDFHGRAVVTAARLADEAEGGEIVVSSLVRELSEPAGDVSFVRSRTVHLKGLPGEHQLHTVRWDAPVPPPPAAAARLVRQGDVWLVRYAELETQIRDMKGIHYLKHLLGHPRREFHVLDLVSLVDDLEGPSGGSRSAVQDGLHASGSDAGPLLDAEAKAAYRDRVEHLRDVISEAESFGDFERAARAREEMEVIAAELSRAVGLGGRDRKAASAAERARVNVTRTIRVAVRKIGEVHPDLGGHLENAIRTGTFCAYQPDPALDVSWKT